MDGSQKYDAEQKKSYFYDIIYTNFKKLSNLMSDVNSEKNGYGGAGAGERSTGRGNAEMLVISVSCFGVDYTGMFTLRQSIEPSAYYMCIFFCTYAILQQKSHPFPPKRETLALPVIHLLHYQEIFRHNEKNFWMTWILILLKLTFASVMSTKINTSILKTFAKETNVFDENTKNSISFGKRLLDWR